MRAWVAAVAIAAGGAIGAGTVQAATSPADGPYLRLEAGATLETDMNVTNPVGPNFTLSPSTAPIAGAALGMRLTPFRFEIDADWMRATISSHSPATVSGSLRDIPIMVNSYIDWANRTRLEPYIGFGLGINNVTLKTTGPGSSYTINASKHAFAYQPIVGVNFALTDQVTIGMQYRYLQSADLNVTNRAGQQLTVSNASHNFLATLTYHFFAPPAPATTPAAAATAAVAPAQPSPPLRTSVAPSGARAAPNMFFVFFDFNSAKLNAAGERAAAEAIASYRQDPSNAMVVRGFTDEVGSDAYNLDLSKRRAMTVYEYFAAHGVKPFDMGIDWQGKANPRVDTPKREPQNRRVEIEM